MKKRGDYNSSNAWHLRELNLTSGKEDRVLTNLDNLKHGSS